MLCEQEPSVDPCWLQNKRARKFKFRKNDGIIIGGISSVSWILLPDICFENFGIGLGFLHAKVAFGKEKTTFTYPGQQICWSGNWLAFHYFFHLVKMLKCFSLFSGNLGIIFYLFIFLF